MQGRCLSAAIDAIDRGSQGFRPGFLTAGTHVFRCPSKVAGVCLSVSNLNDPSQSLSCEGFVYDRLYVRGRVVTTGLFLSVGPIPHLNVWCLSVRRGTGWLGVIPISDEMQDSGGRPRQGLDPLDFHDRLQFVDDQVLPNDLSNKNIGASWLRIMDQSQEEQDRY